MITPKTVDHHVSAVLGKLGVASRREAGGRRRAARAASASPSARVPDRERYSISNRAWLVGAAVPLVAERVERRVELGRAAVSRALARARDRRAVARLEVLAVVVRALERGDVEHVALDRARARRGRPAARARAPRCPTAAGAGRRAGGGGANGPIVRNSPPIMPSGVQLSSPIVPPGRQTRTSSSAACWWCGANITPIADMTTSKRLVLERQVLGVGLDPLELEARGLGAARARPRAARA